MNDEKNLDLYFSYRSPYSYLILPRMLKLKKESKININFKIVYPIAIRMPGWFDKKNIDLRKRIYDYKLDLKICQDCKM